ncbi:MAG: hypothetical protein ABIO02_01140 [Patescibacteria group bacterium]
MVTILKEYTQAILQPLDKNLVVEKPTYSIYKDLPPVEYAGFLSLQNEINVANHRSRIAELPLDLEDSCILMAGSDGKLEKHAQSLAELVIVQNSRSESSLPLYLRQEYDYQYGRGEFRRHFTTDNTGMSEVKRLGTGEVPVSFAFRESDLVYPDRALNTVLVAGNEEIHKATRRQALEEMGGKRALSVRIRDHLRKQYQHYHKGLETGVIRHQEVYSMNPPVQFYDENPATLRVGFKLPILRTVQRHLDRVIACSLRDGTLDLEEAVEQLPTTTLGKIDYLTNRGVIPENLQIADAYIWALQQYHYAQEAYKNSRTPVSVPYDLEKFSEYRSVVIDFTNRGNH